MGTDGELRYDDEVPGGMYSSDGMLDAIGANGDTLKAAFKKGEVHAVHIRIFKPYDSSLGLDNAASHGQYIEKDSNEAGRSSVYYFLSPDAMEDAEKVKLYIGHETRHGMLKTELAETFTDQEKQDIAESCTALKDIALEQVKGSQHSVINDMEKMKYLAGAKYAGAYDRVIDAMRKGMHDQLPLTDNSKAAIKRFGLPECFLQAPNRSVGASLQADGLTLDNVPDEYGDAVIDCEEDWYKVMKSATIYGVLNESNLLSYGDDNQDLGHSFDNVAELVTSVANIVEQEPEETADSIARLTHKQQLPIIKLVRSIQGAQIRNHQGDAEYVEAANKAYDKFYAGLGATA